MLLLYSSLVFCLGAFIKRGAAQAVALLIDVGTQVLKRDTLLTTSLTPRILSLHA